MDKRRLAVLGAVIVSAGVLGGVVLLGTFAPKPPTTDLSLVFSTKAPMYAVGDVVEFFLTNNRAEAVALPCQNDWLIERNMSGNWSSVYDTGCALSLWPVQPGETIEWSWRAETKTDYPGYVPVEAGSYRIRLSVWIGRDIPQLVEIVAFFELR